jgi:hypothetical protein
VTEIVVELAPDGEHWLPVPVATFTLRPVRIGLDVNGDHEIDDGALLMYLPGYDGATPVLSAGDFRTTTYTGPQQINLVVEGLGTKSDVDEIIFKIAEVTSHPGYAENAGHRSVDDPGKKQDYSLDADADAERAIVTPAMANMQAGRTWVSLYAKDYGAWATFVVSVRRGNRSDDIHRFTVPADADGDKLADRWERLMVDAWNRQYNSQVPRSLVFYDPADKTKVDAEHQDPDGLTGRLFAHATPGDHIPIQVEYRGFILDGGGDGGPKQHGGGHLRLSPARKEILLEVDHAPAQSLTNLPPGGISAYLDHTAQVWGNQFTGAGVAVYYLIEDTELPAPPFNVGDDKHRLKGKLWQYMRQQRGSTTRLPAFVNRAFRRYLNHVIVLDSLPEGYPPARALATGAGADIPGDGASDEIGVYFFTGSQQLVQYVQQTGIPFEDHGGVVIAHELMHIVIQPKGAGWLPNEHHVIDENGLMFQTPRLRHMPNGSVQMVRIIELEANAIDLRSNPALYALAEEDN